jgi:hypothetical protein
LIIRRGRNMDRGASALFEKQCNRKPNSEGGLDAMECHVGQSANC